MRVRIASLVAALPVAFVALPAFAADEAQGGLPQFDARFFPGQLFWLACSFALLYGLMALVALPRVQKTQTNRGTVIAGEIAAAQKASEEAKASVALVEKSLNEARAKAQASVSEMVAQVTEDAQARQTAKEKELQRRLRSAEESIAVTREAALKSVGASAHDLATAMIDKVIGSKGRAA